MQPNQETPTLENLQCTAHGHPITTFCTSEDCSNKLICDDCQPTHTEDHKDFFKNSQDLFNDEIVEKLQAKRLELAQDNPEESDSVEKVDFYFEELLTMMTKKIKEMSQSVQGALKESLIKENENNIGKYTQLEESLTGLKTSLTSSTSPDLQNQLIDDYLKARNQGLKLLETPTNTDQIKVDFSPMENFYKEFTQQAENITSNMIASLQKTEPEPTNLFSLERILEVNSKGLTPQCLAEIKHNCFALGTIDGKVSVWDSTTMQVFREKHVHNLKVTSLLFMAGYDLLVSAGEDRRLCVSRFGKSNDFVTFFQSPQEQNISCLTEITGTGTFVGLLGKSEIGIWCIRLTKFKGNEHYEILYEGRIPTNQKVKTGQIINIPGKDMVAVGFEIGLIGFFCLKQKKLAFGVYAEAFLSGFWYCEKRQKLFAQISPDVVRIWDYSGEKPIKEVDVKIGSQAQGPYYTLGVENNVFCCGGSSEVVVVDLESGQEKKLELGDFKADGLVYLEGVKKVVATDYNTQKLAVLNI